MITSAAFGQAAAPGHAKHGGILVPTKLTFEQLPIEKADSEDEGEEAISIKPNDWPMYNYNPKGTRYNRAEEQLKKETVQQLKVKWTLITDGNVNATPIVVDGKVYAGDTSGYFYALNKTGKLLWKTKVNGPITASALVTPQRVIFGDLAGYVYGLNVKDGSILWTIRPNPNQYAQVYGSPTLVGKQVVIGIASNEDALSPPCTTYTSCQFRGSVVQLNPLNGKVLWQTYTITSDESAKGASGAGVWSTPTYDATTGLIYVTTGDNYTNPATPGSDAFIALNARTGEVVWLHQLVADDAGPDHPDVDFGDSPQIYRLQDGRKVVGAGGKNGTYYVLDAKTGTLVNQNPLLPQSCSPTIGLFADSAVAEGVVYANGTDSCTFTGTLFAVTGDASQVLWHFTTPGSAALSGVAVAHGVVYFQVANPNGGGFLYALDGKDGKPLLQMPMSTSAISGPSISTDQLYLGTGITFPPYITIQGGSIMAIGL